MKLLNALAELASMGKYISSQVVANPIDPADELRHLEETCQLLKTRISLKKMPNVAELETLAAQCRTAEFSLSGFTRRELRLLSWHNGLLLCAQFRRNLAEFVRKDEVRPNLSVLAKVYFGAWGHHEDAYSFEQLLREVAERQSPWSTTLSSYQRDATRIFSSHADEFLANDCFSLGMPVSQTLEKWDVPPTSCLASSVIQQYVHRLTVRIEDGKGAYLEDVLVAIQLPGVQLDVFRKVIGRLILCGQSDWNEDFRKELELFVIDHPNLGDPRLQQHAPHWVGIEPRAELKFRGWRNKLDLVFFFNSVMRDREDKHDRKSFWLEYVDKAHESFVALCPTDVHRLRSSLADEKIQYRRIMDDQGVSCFAMRFRGGGADIVITEFSKVGRVRILSYKSFIQKIRDVNRQDFLLRELRNDEGAEASFVHLPGWQAKVRNALARYGFRPR
jgi:EH_Signature domain